MLQKKVVLLIIIIGSFLLSLTLYFTGDRYKSIRFKFYHELSDRVVVEERDVLVKNSYFPWEERVLDEMFLGPMSVFNRKLVPYGMVPNSFFVKDGVAYLDLPVEFALEKDGFRHKIKDRISLIKDNLKNNSWKINSVIITIDGQIPNYDYELSLKSEEILTDKK